MSQQEPVDTLLDRLISISNQLIQSSTNALASTINSRDCLSTFTEIENLLDRSISNKQLELNQKISSIQSHQIQLDRIQDHLHSLWPNLECQTDLHHHHHLHLHQFFLPLNHHHQQQQQLPPPPPPPPPPQDHSLPEPQSNSHPNAKLAKLQRRNHPNRTSQSTIGSIKEYSSPTSQLLSPSVPSARSDPRSILLDHHARQSFDLPKPTQTLPPAPATLHSSASSSSLAALLSPFRIVKTASSIFSSLAPSNPPSPPPLQTKLSRPSIDSTHSSATHSRCQSTVLPPSTSTSSPELAPPPTISLDPSSLALSPALSSTLHHELKLLKVDHYPP